MQTYDIIMLVIVASATIFGAIKGFAWQVASLASIFVSYVLATYFRNDVAKLIDAQPPWNMFLAMLLLYFGSSLVIWMIFRLVSSSIDKIRLKDFDRQLGAGFGLLKGALLCCIVTMFAMTLLGRGQQQAIANSRSGHYISRVLANAGGILPEEVKQIVGPYIDNVERQLEQGRGQEFNNDPNASGTANWQQGFPNPTSAVNNGVLPNPFNGNVGNNNAVNGGTAQGGGILDRFFGGRSANSTNSNPQPLSPWGTPSWENSSNGNLPNSSSTGSNVPSGWPVSQPQNQPMFQPGNWPNTVPNSGSNVVPNVPR